ncbi:MAG: flavodoxin family protein [Candidatus Bipolaricaulia bacterium]
MKILVGYFSETGNTKKMAEAIGEEAKAGGNEVLVATVGEIKADALGGYDVVFLGSTCHSADIAAPVRNLLDGIPAGSLCKVAGFVTHSTTMPDAGDSQKKLYEQWAGKCPGTFSAACEEKGIGFLGYFHCQGAPSPQVEAFIRSTIVTDEAQWNAFIEDARKHPTTEDIEAARAFAREVLAKA